MLQTVRKYGYILFLLPVIILLLHSAIPHVHIDKRVKHNSCDSSLHHYEEILSFLFDLHHDSEDDSNCKSQNLLFEGIAKLNISTLFIISDNEISFNNDKEIIFQNNIALKEFIFFEKYTSVLLRAPPICL